MRLKLILPPVDPTQFPEPTACPQAGCGGQHFQLHQAVPKPLRDTQVDHATVGRYRCARCGHTFRVDPPGVRHRHTSARLRGVAVMLYVLGLSYGAVALVLDALGHPLSKSAVYDAVQAAGERVPGLRRHAVQVPVGQVCLAHVVRNTDAWVNRMTPEVQTDADGSLAVSGSRRPRRSPISSPSRR